MYYVNHEIEEEVTSMPMGELTRQLLAALIDEPYPPAQPRRADAKRQTIGFASMDDEERRAYKTRKQRERRARNADRGKAEDMVVFEAATAREALADAAIILLASSAPGAETVRTYLAKVFHKQPGAPLTIEARIRSGHMRPKYLRHTEAPAA